MYFPISFSTTRLSIVGTCWFDGDMVQFRNHTVSKFDYWVFDRLLDTNQTNAFFYVAIGY